MANYYVDQTLGDDSNPGTITQPWKTISKVNSTSFSPGDSVYFKRGEVWRETLIIPSSGSDGNPITFGAYGTGDKPKISGADVVTGWSGPDENGEYYKSGFTTVPKIVLRDGSRISKGMVGSLGVDEWGYDSGTLYLGFDPTGYTIEAGQRTSPVTINGKSYITVQDITIYGGNNRADMDAAGGNICIYSTSTNIFLSNITSYACHFSGIGVGGSNVSDITISNVVVYDTLAAGIRFASGVTNSTLSNFLVHDCAMLPSDDGAGGDGGGIEVTTDCDNIDIFCGEVYNTGAGLTSSQKPDPGIAIYQSTNIDVTRVKIHNCYGGGAYYRSVTSGKSCSGNFTYNIVYNNGDLSVTSDTVLYGLRLGGVDGGKVTVNVYNNVFASNRCEVVGSTGKMGMVYVGSYSNIEFKNNILKDPIGDYSYYVLTSGTSVTYTASNNCYYTTGNNNRWSWAWSDKTNLSDWQSASGETNSLNLDPSFVDPDNGDFHLKVGSPCIDAGTDVGLDRDFDYNPVPWGTAPDIGAFELVRRITVLRLSHRPEDCRSGGWVDLSRFGNHGMPHGGVRPFQIAPGVMGFKFDGVDDYVELPKDKSLDITDEVTFQAWFYAFSFESPEDYPALIDRGGWNRNWKVWFIKDPPKVHLVWGNGDDYDTLQSDVISANRWYYVAVVFKSASYTKLYLNNLVEEKDTNVSWIIQSDYPFTIQDPVRVMKIVIAEPAIIASAWSEDEIRENMYRSPIYRMLRGLPRSFVYVKVPFYRRKRCLI